MTLCPPYGYLGCHCRGRMTHPISSSPQAGGTAKAPGRGLPGALGENSSRGKNILQSSSGVARISPHIAKKDGSREGVGFPGPKLEGRRALKRRAATQRAAGAVGVVGCLVLVCLGVLLRAGRLSVGLWIIIPRPRAKGKFERRFFSGRCATKPTAGLPWAFAGMRAGLTGRPSARADRAGGQGFVERLALCEEGP